MVYRFVIVLVALAFTMMVNAHPERLTYRNKRGVPVAPTKSPCGDGKTLCEATDLYPTEYIDNILKDSANKFKDLLGVDELNVDVGLRADFGAEIEICKSTEQMVFPKAAKNKDGDWIFVINQPNNMQGVRAEICEEENQSCALSENFPNGYSSSCKQKYIYRKMAVIHQNGSLGVDLIRLPSSCNCFVTTPPAKRLSSAISGEETSQSTLNKTPSSPSTPQDTNTPVPGSTADDGPATPTRICGDNTTLCEVTEQLPSDSQGIDKIGATKHYVSEEKTPVDVNGLTENLSTEFELCRSIEQVVYPKTVLNGDGEWQNLPENQGFRVEICNGENLPCALSENFPPGFKSLCKQKYTYRKLLTVLKNGTVSVHSLKLPSTCHCVATNALGMGMG